MFGPTSPSFKTGQEQIGQGAGGLTTARNYFEAIASGDPAKMSAVLAPQISALQQQTGQRVATTGQFAGRSGGTASSMLEAGSEAQRSIQNLFDLLGPEAMAEVAKIAGTQEAMGTGLQGQSLEALATIGGQASGARAGDVATQQAQQAAIMEALVSLI